MPGYRYLRPEDVEPTDEERQAARDSASAQQNDSTIGGTAGGVLGGALGALGFLGGPELAAVTVPAGVGIGSSIGSAIGGGIGNDQAKKADDILTADALERQKKLTAYQLREQALQHLLTTG